MKKHGFTSVFADDLDAYLQFKQSLGSTGKSRVWYLERFDRYCCDHGLDVFDRDTVEGWVRSELARGGVYRSWMSYIREFGRWLVAYRDPHAYVLSAQWKAPLVRACPYLFTTDQITRFFTAAACLQTSSPWQWQAVAFFTLMHSCGIRTGEVQMLRCLDVDYGQANVMITESKTRRARRLPITTEVAEILHSCDQISRSRFPARDRFFVSSTGAPVTVGTVGVIFNRIWDQAGLARPAGKTQPRPYDFRHHFAYANLERWMADGTDVTTMLPYLSVYMGHATIESTYYYIHTSPDFMDTYADLTRQASAMILPEVGFE